MCYTVTNMLQGFQAVFNQARIFLSFLKERNLPFGMQNKRSPVPDRASSASFSLTKAGETFVYGTEYVSNDRAK